MNPAPLYCDACGAANRPQARFCLVCGQSLPGIASDAEQVVPNVLIRQRYHVIAQIGKGGFGAVYKAEDGELGNRIVAVKEMSQRGLTTQEIAEAADAFKREALLLAGLLHPNLPRIYEHFFDAGHWYLVMDFIEGETLEDYLSSSGKSHLPVEEALDIGIQLCAVLDYLHTQQPPIIFRDLKPANVIRTANGHLYLIDFGIARHFKLGQARDTVAFGSPGYAAPEQYGKAQTTPQSDIYSLGAMLHQLLTGSDPSEKPFHFAAMGKGVQPVPVRLEKLVMQMVEMDEDRRPASMVAVKQELQHIATALASGQVDMVLPRKRPLRYGQRDSALASGQVDIALPPVPARPASIAALGTVLCTFRAHHSVRSLAWSPDGTRIVTAGDSNAVQVWDARSGLVMLTYNGHTNVVRAVAWSPDGTRIVSGSEDRTAQVWDAENGSPILTYHGHSHYVNAVTWSPDGKYIASASIDRTVQVWEPATGQKALTYLDHAEVIYQVAWSPDGSRVASGSFDGKVRVWYASNGNNVYICRGHTALVRAVAWSRDSQYIASGDYSVHVWHSGTGYLVRMYRNHTALIRAVAWSPDGTRVASCSWDNTVHVWNATTGRNIYTFPAHSLEVNAVAWSPDGSRIASGGNDKTVQVWLAE